MMLQVPDGLLHPKILRRESFEGPGWSVALWNFNLWPELSDRMRMPCACITNPLTSVLQLLPSGCGSWPS